MLSRSGWRPWRAWGPAAASLALLAGSVLLGGVGLPPEVAWAQGAAPGSTATGSTAPRHPDEDIAGAQIRRYEGVGGPAASSPTGSKTFAQPDAAATGAPAGMDVSSHQGNVDWGAAAHNGGTFAYVKATEGTGYTNPFFDQQYGGSRGAGLIRGAYHFALPDQSSGADQADYFVDHGGGWARGGTTLPPALDIEYNPYGDVCYGLGAEDMVNWIRDFSNTVAARVGRDPVIYTSTNWWGRCAGNDSSFGATNPLWVPRYGSSVGQLPAGWDYQTFWQYADSGVFPGDQDQFNGPYNRLRTFAAG